MSFDRVFYITQGSLIVWLRQDLPDHSVVFPDNDEGIAAFEDYIDRTAEQPGFVLIDVIEEEFAADSIPRLGLRDRAALLKRRVQRKFPRSPYRLSVYQGRHAADDEECVAIHSAISNHELLDVWLQPLLARQVPIGGISSVPLMAPQLLRRLFKPGSATLFLTQHQGNRLRQVFLRGAGVQSARLSATPAIDAPDYPDAVITELERSRRYLERSRLLNSMEQLDVCMLVEPETAEALVERADGHSPLRFKTIDPAAAAEKIGLKRVCNDRLEAIYVAAAFQRRPGKGYAASGEKRYWAMRRARHAVIGASVAASLACSLLIGANLSDAWLFHQRSTAIRTQVTQLSETFRRDHDRFSPIRADSYEMKLAVDTGDYILANRLPVPWVMQQLGFVLGDFPDVQLRQLSWRVDTPPSGTPQRPRSDNGLPVPIPMMTAISAELTAEIRPFDGDLRAAFARIEALADAMQARTEFEQVATVEYPVDASPAAAIAGEIAQSGDAGTARFRLRLYYPLLPAATAGGDDAI